MNRMPLPSVETLSADEFLARFDDADTHKRTQLIQMFKIATQELEALSNSDSSAIEPPQIRIRIAEELQAEANPWAIYVNEGLVNYYLNLTEPPILEIIPELKEHSPFFNDSYFYRKMAFMWMVLHEFFHSRREHNEVAKAVGISKETWLAIEMDADLLATARVYRHAQQRYQNFYSDLFVRKLTLSFLYWGFRGLPEPEGDDSHPSSIDRLGMMMQKLIMLRRVQEDPPDPDFKLEESKANLEPIFICFINCELAFSKYTGVKPDLPSIEKFCSGITRPIVVRWDEMRSHVTRLSRTPA